MESLPTAISAIKEALAMNLYSIDMVKKDMNREFLSMAYTPGVGEVCLQIQANPHLIDQYTLRPRSIAVVSNGAVLNCEGKNFMPVMDWFIIQIKYYSGYDAFPFVIRKQTDLAALWKDLSSTYGTVLYLDGNVDATHIPADLLFIEQHKVQKCFWGDITDARLTSKMIAYCISNKIKGIPTLQQYTAGIHYHSNNYIEKKTYNFINKGLNINELSLRFHKYYRGKIQIQLNFHDITPLKLLFTEAHLRQIVKQSDVPSKTKQLCTIVTDGTSILGLGNIGPSAGLPVMEGKSLLFKLLGDVEVVPFCMYPRKTAKQQIQAIINSVGYYNAINLEDIKAPECFEVQTGLKQLKILPVFHDDQHGTAVVVLAALINALKVAQKSIDEVKIVVNGAGAAGITISKLLVAYGSKKLIVCDTQGAIYKSRKNNMNQTKVQIANISNFQELQGNLQTIIKGCDVFIGVSKGNILNAQDIKSMNTNPIIFALANPTPEIMPDIALEAGAFIYGSGRSDFPNQINNSLCFPGIFRGITQHHLKEITMEMKLQAAIGISKSLRSEPRRDYIIPDSLDRDIALMICQELKPKL